MAEVTKNYLTVIYMLIIANVKMGEPTQYYAKHDGKIATITSEFTEKLPHVILTLRDMHVCQTPWKARTARSEEDLFTQTHQDGIWGVHLKIIWSARVF